ncbi:hypothetical protein U27_01377 [Candidatus Vecturithrix granuli]|uniref:Uncharacterized protein n=1 Tax=Vecturithrix granuli TaxID=1499967 RepID=A0A081CA71_VECG1|nr:hypothetical protein U27_01377 [Candidatus Vecturithrix granuli]
MCVEMQFRSTKKMPRIGEYGASMIKSLTPKNLYPLQTLTVGSGISPNQLHCSSRTLTAGRELHPAPKDFWFTLSNIFVQNPYFEKRKPVKKIQ